MKTGRVLVTGASGFIGKVVCTHLLDHGYSVRAATSSEANRALLDRYLARSIAAGIAANSKDRVTHGGASGKPSVETVVVASPTWSRGAWDAACEEVDAVIHLAGRAHVLRETAADPRSEFRKVNCDMTVALAESAAKKRVRRVVFVSSIGVNGNSTEGVPMRESDAPEPHDLYAQSKLEAEHALCDISRKSDLEVVIVRPPLVYGPGASGNFARLVKLVGLGLPLPLAAVRNTRSLVGVENLADALVSCVAHPAAGGQVFLVADVDWSIVELISRIGSYMNKPVRLFPVPVRFLRMSAGVIGRSAIIDRLCDSLAIDAGKIRDCLDWKPRISPDDGLRRAVEWYVAHRQRS